MPKISTVSTKGQVTIPNHLRIKYGIKEGTNVIFTATDQNTIMMRVVNKDLLSFCVELSEEDTEVGEVKRKIPISLRGATI